MFYTVRAPWILKKIYSSLTWEKQTEEKILYLSFDDGPHPVATEFVLNCLKQYNAKATFFCIGRNVAERTQLYQRILEEGHKVGNHTYDHLNGWKTSNKKYFENISEAQNISTAIYFDLLMAELRSSRLNYYRKKNTT